MIFRANTGEDKFCRVGELSADQLAELQEQANAIASQIHIAAGATNDSSAVGDDPEDARETLTDIELPEWMQIDELPDLHSAGTETESRSSEPLLVSTPTSHFKGKAVPPLKRSNTLTKKENKPPITTLMTRDGRKASDMPKV